ncbi:MAG: 2-oxoacid:acceptor oxidoreductase family protein [Nanoarchaeota archaeon]|nr:2-oxoacid:acceptor oxidoreductase family protein [Nanoarchaeota archaeon]
MHFEIRFHGRGGQGAKSASAILAEAALNSGKYIQSFPEYGAERQGAPMKAFNRFSDTEIRKHSGVTNPNLVVVMDETLLKNIPVAEGLDVNGILIVNTDKDVNHVKEKTGFNGTINVINATKIAFEEIGRNNPNSAMLGAIQKATDIVPMDLLKEEFRAKFAAKLPAAIIDKNISAIERGANELK